MRSRLLIALPALGLSAPALAQSANYSALTSAVDFSAVITAVIAVAAIVAGVLVVRKGIRFVLGAIK